MVRQQADGDSPPASAEDVVMEIEDPKAAVAEPLLDLDEERRKYRKTSWLCGGTSAIIISLLLSLVLVCIILPQTRAGHDLPGNKRVHYLAAGEQMSWGWGNACPLPVCLGPKAVPHMHALRAAAPQLLQNTWCTGARVRGCCS